MNSNNTLSKWPVEPEFRSADYFDNQYNNRLRVPSFNADHFERWIQRSKQARQQLDAQLDIAYGSAERNETLDVFGVSGAKKPVVVFIHGGYWRSLDKSDFSFVAEPFVQANACVVVTNYALCPKATIDQIVMQQVQALIWVYRNIAKFGGDPNRIRVIGHSAGGHLAAMLLACRWQQVGNDLPARLVTRAISLSGLFDLQPIQQCPMLQTDLQLTDTQVAQCSPALFKVSVEGKLATDAKQSLQLLAFCGADESAEFLRQNALIEYAWGNQVVTKREALLGLNHFSIVDALCSPGHYLNTASLRFFKPK